MSAICSAVRESVNDLNTSALQGTLAWEQLECQRSAPQSAAARRRIRSSHFNQLFHHLRFATRASRRDVLNDDLGHVDNPLGLTVHNMLVADLPTREKESKEFHRLFLHLRLNVVEHWDHRHWVDDLLHGVLQNTHLGPDASKAVKRRTPEFFLVQREELAVPGHTGPLAPQSVVRGLRPGSLLAPWSIVRHKPNITAVMKGCCQGHLQRKLLVPPVHAQPTVTSPLRCPTAVVATQRRVVHWDRTTSKSHKRRKRTPV